MRTKISNIPLDNSGWDYLFLIGCLIYIMIPATHSLMPITGILLIVLSTYLCIKSRKNKLLLVMVGLISLVNYSLGYTDCIKLGVGVAEWQTKGLRSDIINPICAKSILLSMAIFNMYIDKKMVNAEIVTLKPKRKSNVLISWGGMCVLFLIISYAYLSISDSSGSYQSVSSPIYEYSLMILCFVWFYSKNVTFINEAIWLYVVLFVFKFLSLGDRSSVLMLMELVAIIYFFNWINLKNLLLFIITGIPFANVIGVIRNIGDQNFISVVLKGLEKGYYIDTVSYAYYSSLAISKLNERVHDKLSMIFGFFGRCVGINSEFGSLSTYARNNWKDLMNYDGGIFGSYFYSFGGYIGVILGSILLGIIVRRIMLAKSDEFLPYKMLLVIYSFRWYLYNPIPLFRSVLIFGTILYLLCKVADPLSKRKVVI